MNRDGKGVRRGVSVRREEIPEELSVLDAERRKCLWDRMLPVILGRGGQKSTLEVKCGYIREDFGGVL